MLVNLWCSAESGAVLGSGKKPIAATVKEKLIENLKIVFFFFFERPFKVVTTLIGRGVQESFFSIAHLYSPFLERAGNLRFFTSISFPTHQKSLKARKKYSPPACFCFALVFIFILTLIAP